MVRLSYPDSQRAILSRLARLLYLEKCVVQDAYWNGPQGLRLTLAVNLEILQPLRRLKVFRGFGRVLWGEAEARWVLQHFPDLEEFGGVELDEAAKRLLKRLKVQ